MNDLIKLLSIINCLSSHGITFTMTNDRLGHITVYLRGGADIASWAHFGEKEDLKSIINSALDKLQKEDGIAIDSL